MVILWQNTMDSKVLTLMLMAARADCITKLPPLPPLPQLPLPSSFSLLCEGTIKRYICRNLMLTWQEAIYTALALFTRVWHSRTRCPWDTPYKASQNIALGSWKWRYFLKYLVWPSHIAPRPKTNCFLREACWACFSKGVGIGNGSQPFTEFLQSMYSPLRLGLYKNMCIFWKKFF